MKKIVVFTIMAIGFILIIIGITIGFPVIEKTIVVTDKIEEKKPPLNISYQQQVIQKVEEHLENNYQLKEGNSTVEAAAFLDTTKDEYQQYKDCGGEIKFSNENNNITYQLTTKCKKDKGNLKVEYKIASLNNINIENPALLEVSNGYFIVGTAKDNKEIIIMKFNDNHTLEFTNSITGDPNPLDASSYATLSDVYEEKDAYYLLGYAQGVTGGSYTNLISQLQKAYQEVGIEQINYGFSFLLKYDKKGNLISEKLIDPIDGDAIFDKILGKYGNELIMTSSSKIAKYDNEKETFKFHNLSEGFIEASYLKNNFLYGYSRKCSYNSTSSKWNQNALVKLNLSGKSIWSQALNYEENLGKNICSNYINNVYNIGMYNAIIYDNNRKISIYNEDGKEMKELDYSKLQKKKKNSIIMYDLRNEEKNIRVILDNGDSLIIDTYNDKYKLINRYATGLYNTINHLETIRDVGNITSKPERFIEFKMLTKNKSALLRIDYLYE